MEVGTRNQRLVTVKPVMDAPVSKGHLCVKGRYAFEFVYAADRITTPMICTESGWEHVSWEEAIAFVAEKLNQMVARYGADSIGVLGSAARRTKRTT